MIKITVFENRELYVRLEHITAIDEQNRLLWFGGQSWLATNGEIKRILGLIQQRDN